MLCVTLWYSHSAHSICIVTHVTVQTSVALLCTHTTAFLQIATELYMVTLPLKLKASMKSISEIKCFVKEAN